MNLTPAYRFWSSSVRSGILLLLMGLCHPGALSAQEEPATLERIGIRPSEQGAEFVLKDSGAPFFVSGFNYIRLRADEGASSGDHSTFDAETKTTKACYDANRAETMVSALSKGG